jgi:hypothetical protein
MSSKRREKKAKLKAALAEELMQKYIAIYKYIGGKRDDETVYYGYGFTFCSKEEEAHARCKSKSVDPNGDSREVVAVWIAEMANSSNTLKLVFGQDTTTGDLRIAESFVRGQVAKAYETGFRKKKDRKNTTVLNKTIKKILAAPRKPKKVKTPSYWPSNYTLKQA